MEFNEKQLKWIEENREYLDNGEIKIISDRLFRPSFEFEKYEIRQLLVGLTLIFDLPAEILKSRKTSSSRTYYPLYIKGISPITDRVKLVEYECIGEPSKGTIIEEIRKALILNHIDGKILNDFMKKVKYNVD